MSIGMGSWRAGCGESRTSGSGGGPGKQTSRNADTAPWADLTSALPRLMRSDAASSKTPSVTVAAKETRSMGSAGYCKQEPRTSHPTSHAA